MTILLKEVKFGINTSYYASAGSYDNAADIYNVIYDKSNAYKIYKIALANAGMPPLQSYSNIFSSLTEDSSQLIDNCIPKFAIALCGYRQGGIYPVFTDWGFIYSDEIMKEDYEITETDIIMVKIPFTWDMFYNMLNNGRNRNYKEMQLFYQIMNIHDQPLTNKEKMHYRLSIEATVSFSKDLEPTDFPNLYLNCFTIANDSPVSLLQKYGIDNLDFHKYHYEIDRYDKSDLHIYGESIDMEYLERYHECEFINIINEITAITPLFYFGDEDIREGLEPLETTSITLRLEMEPCSGNYPDSVITKNFYFQKAEIDND